MVLSSAETASNAVLDALTDEICVIDSSGNIVAVNEAWTRFAAERGATPASTGIGQNYLDVTRTAAEAGMEDAARVLDGVMSVLRGQTEQFSMEYECSGKSLERSWFLLTVTALARLPGALISHSEVTARRKVEEVLRLSGEPGIGGSLFEAVLPRLVKNLALALNVRHAFLSELLDARTRKARLLAHWNGTEYGPLREYTMTGIPSEQILAGRTCVFPSAIQKLFPADPMLEQIGAEGYLAVPLLDSQGQPLGHLGVIDTRPLDDVSFAETTLRVFAARATPELERRRAERRLADQSRILANAPDAIVGTDEDFRITYWNHAAETTYGWPAEEALGRDARDLLHPELSDEERAVRASIARDEGEFRGQISHLRKDGSRITIDATAMPLREPDGRVRGFISINRDNTEREQVRRALREAEEKTTAIMDAIPDMMFTLDGAGRILSFKPSQSFQPLIPPSAFLGKLVEEVLPAEVAVDMMESIRSALASGQTRTLVYQLVKDGSPRDYEARVLSLGPNEVLVIVRDYTGQTHRWNRPPQGRAASRPNLTSQILRPRQGDKPRVLIVDEDVHALRFLRRLLERSGQEVLVTSDPEEAVRLAEMEEPDLILVDFSLSYPGFDLFRNLQTSGASLIVVSPAEREEEALEALRMGADDYVRKPISPSELTARIEAVLKRRLLPDTVSRRFELGDLIVDTANHLVTVNGEAVALTPTEYRLLYELAASSGRVLTHAYLMERVWGEGYRDDQDILRSFIRTLRQKLHDNPRAPRFIRSVRGVGYQMVVPVRPGSV